jgi:hypothetical protein
MPPLAIAFRANGIDSMLFGNFAFQSIGTTDATKPNANGTFPRTGTLTFTLAKGDGFFGTLTSAYAGTRYDATIRGRINGTGGENEAKKEATLDCLQR